MKVIAIEHKITGNEDSTEYFGKLAEAIKLRPDVIMGPDYGITSFNSDGTVDFESQDQAQAQLERLSVESPETLIIPGTWPILLGDSEMGHAAPIYRDGAQIANFRKQTNVENSDIAKQNELQWQRGDYDQNKIIHQGKKIAIEICSDHGKQPIDRDTFLEAILARDINAGFYIGASNDNFARYAIVNDSENPKIEGLKYDPDAHMKMTFAEEQKLNSFLTEFTLK
jgi:hypothetical protein